MTAINKEDKANNVVVLSTPIETNGDPITQVNMREPKAGELRGLKLLDVFQLDYESMEQLFPRITTPSLTVEQIRNLTVADLTSLCTKVGEFMAGKPSP